MKIKIKLYKVDILVDIHLILYNTENDICKARVNQIV
jgi:hypothetical protein